MGAWDELDTLISAEVKLDDLDKISDLDDEYGIFDDLKEYCTDLKTAIRVGSHKGVDDLATRDRSFQEQYIAKNCKNPSGMLASSINKNETNSSGDYFEFIIGTIINHIYPLAVEYGRDEVHPIPPKKRLRFYGEGGYLIYPLMSREAKPRPFVAPAYDDTLELSEKIMLAYVGDEIENI